MCEKVLSDMQRGIPLLKAFRKIKVSDRELDQVQQNVLAAFGPLTKIEILQGRQINAVDLTTTAVNVAHGLGRQPLGYIVTDLNKNAVVFRTDWDANFISLQSSATGTIVSLWVY